MTDHYEITRSRGAPLIMIFCAGEWDSLPFEIRLLQPWYGSEFLDRTRLNTQQSLDIARLGYTMVDSQSAPANNLRAAGAIRMAESAAAA